MLPALGRGGDLLQEQSQTVKALARSIDNNPSLSDVVSELNSLALETEQLAQRYREVASRLRMSHPALFQGDAKQQQQHQHSTAPVFIAYNEPIPQPQFQFVPLNEESKLSYGEEDGEYFETSASSGRRHSAASVQMHATYKTTLISGVKVDKFKHSGIKVRWVWTDAAFQKLFWGAYNGDVENAKGFILVDDISEVCTNRLDFKSNCKSFLKAVEEDESLCLSLMTPDRTLDLAFASTASRDSWASAMHALLSGDLQTPPV